MDFTERFWNLSNIWSFYCKWQYSFSNHTGMITSCCQLLSNISSYTGLGESYLAYSLPLERSNPFKKSKLAVKGKQEMSSTPSATPNIILILS